MGLVLGLAATVLSILFWSRVAQVDGRHAIARAPWVWGLAGGGWTLTCAYGYGHSPTRLALDQIVIVIAMTCVIAFHEHRRTTSRHS